jgi:hypothetical protein
MAMAANTTIGVFFIVTLFAFDFIVIALDVQSTEIEDDLCDSTDGREQSTTSLDI